MTPRAVVFIVTAAAIYSLGHGLRTFRPTAVPRSTQPSTFRISALAQSSSKMAMVDADGSSVPMDSQQKLFGLV